jgi:hypothetical protein
MLTRKTKEWWTYKERVQAGTINEDIIRVNNAETPSLVGTGAPRENRIIISGIRGERCGGVWVALEVGCLRLDQSHVNVGGIGDLVIVQDAVLSTGSIQPHWPQVGLD